MDGKCGWHFYLILGLVGKRLSSAAAQGTLKHIRLTISFAKFKRRTAANHRNDTQRITCTHKAKCIRATSHSNARCVQSSRVLCHGFPHPFRCAFFPFRSRGIVNLYCDSHVSAWSMMRRISLWKMKTTLLSALAGLSDAVCLPLVHIRFVCHDSSSFHSFLCLSIFLFAIFFVFFLIQMPIVFVLLCFYRGFLRYSHLQRIAGAGFHGNCCHRHARSSFQFRFRTQFLGSKLVCFLGINLTTVNFITLNIHPRNRAWYNCIEFHFRSFCRGIRTYKFN